MSGTRQQRDGAKTESVGPSRRDIETGKERNDAPASNLIIGKSGAGAVITLNRPQALNAINSRMFGAIADALPGFARDPEIYALLFRSSSKRAFCAGGDVRQIVDLGRADVAAASHFLRDEYALNWQLECFTKPTLSFIDAIVMGSGVGLTLYGTHRIAGENYSFAMPETRIGFFPDIGVSWAFARMPHEIGMYLGLTGRAIGRADAYRLGLVTHCIAAEKFEDITAAVCDADPVDPVLDERHENPGPGDLAGLEPVINKCFSAPGVEEIIDNLRELRGARRDWADECARELAACAPLSLKVTHRLIRAARAMDLRQTLQIDYRLAQRFLGASDFYEGVRAALVDKDKEPRWEPADVKDVSAAMVDACFAPLGEQDLELPPREDVQAAPT